MNIKEYIKAIEKELKGLKIKIDSLNIMIGLSKRDCYPKAHKHLLEWKYEVMTQYVKIVEVEIELVKGEMK